MMSPVSQHALQGSYTAGVIVNHLTSPLFVTANARWGQGEGSEPTSLRPPPSSSSLPPPPSSSLLSLLFQRPRSEDERLSIVSGNVKGPHNSNATAFSSWFQYLKPP